MASFGGCADANVGKKTCRGRREDGTVWEKIIKWFGCKLHLIVDAVYELPVLFGFEQHFIRGPKKMRLRMGLALIVMLAMALGRAKEKRLDRLRSLTRVA